MTMFFGACVCYRLPGQNAAEVNEFMFSIENSWFLTDSENFKSIILTRDFNDPCFIWDTNHFTRELKNNFLKLTKSFGFSQLINKPTRNSVILDLILTNCVELFVGVKVLDHSRIGSQTLLR